MAVAGRPLKPEGTTVHRNPPSRDFITVPNVPFETDRSLPKHPIKDGYHHSTYNYWYRLRAMPHCVMWTDMDWEFAEYTALLKDRYYSGEDLSSGLAGEIRRREEQMGTTIEFRYKMRIRYVDPPKEEPTTSAITSIHSASRRNRLKE